MSFLFDFGEQRVITAYVSWTSAIKVPYVFLGLQAHVQNKKSNISSTFYVKSRFKITSYHVRWSCSFRDPYLNNSWRGFSKCTWIGNMTNLGAIITSSRILFYWGGLNKRNYYMFSFCLSDYIQFSLSWRMLFGYKVDYQNILDLVWTLGLFCDLYHTRLAIP